MSEASKMMAAAEDAHSAATRLERAAEAANSAAARMEDVLHRLTALTGDGYGNNVCRFIEAAERVAGKEVRHERNTLRANALRANARDVANSLRKWADAAAEVAKRRPDAYLEEQMSLTGYIEENRRLADQLDPQPTVSEKP